MPMKKTIVSLLSLILLGSTLFLYAGEWGEWRQLRKSDGSDFGVDYRTKRGYGSDDCYHYQLQWKIRRRCESSTHSVTLIVTGVTIHMKAASF